MDMSIALQIGTSYFGLMLALWVPIIAMWWIKRGIFD